MNWPAVRRIVFAVLVPLLLVPAQLPAKHQLPEGWEVLTMPPLQVRYPPGLERTAAEITDKAAAYLEDTGEFLGLTFSGEYTIILADSEEQFTLLQPGRIRAKQPVPVTCGGSSVIAS